MTALAWLAGIVLVWLAANAIAGLMTRAVMRDRDRRDGRKQY